MPRYTVTLSLYGTCELTVNARDEKDAIDVAESKLSDMTEGVDSCVDINVDPHNSHVELEEEDHDDYDGPDTKAEKSLDW